MENRNSRNPSTRRPFDIIPRASLFSCLVFSLRSSVGCGAPGEPIAPSPPIPTAITDLSVRQSGDGAQLTFTLPYENHSRRAVSTEPPAIEVLRGALKSDGSPDPKSFRVVDTIPGSMVSKYLSDDHAQIVDPVSPQDTRAHPGATLAYRVRTRVSKKRASPESNAVTVRIFPVPQRVTSSSQAADHRTAIDLTWTSPAQTSGGDPLPRRFQSSTSIVARSIRAPTIPPRRICPTPSGFLRLRSLAQLGYRKLPRHSI